MDLLHANDRPGQYPDSYYAATANGMAAHPSLDTDIGCDVCIVGAGYTGLSAALHCAERGLDTVLLDAHRIGWGASGRNGGQLGSGQRRDQEDLEQMLGIDKAHRLWELAEESKRLVHDLIGRHRIECEFRHGILYADHRQRFVKGTRGYVEKLRSGYGYEKVRFIDQEEVRSILATNAYFGGMLDEGAGHLHPLNLALGLGRAACAAGARIFEKTEVTGITPADRVEVATEKGTVRAGFVLLACNGYVGALGAGVRGRVMPINNFIIATQPLDGDEARSLIANNAAVADSRNVINYFRLSTDNRLLFGGGENYGYRFPSDIRAFVRRSMLQIYPQLSDTVIDYGWGGTLGITVNRMPHLARLAPNILSASGYSGHGIGIATLCGKLAAEAIGGTAARFDLMASVPTPRFPGGGALRTPLLAVAMVYYALKDRL